MSTQPHPVTERAKGRPPAVAETQTSRNRGLRPGEEERCRCCQQGQSRTTEERQELESAPRALPDEMVRTPLRPKAPGPPRAVFVFARTLKNLQPRARKGSGARRVLRETRASIHYRRRGQAGAAFETVRELQEKRRARELRVQQPRQGTLPSSARPISRREEQRRQRRPKATIAEPPRPDWPRDPKLQTLKGADPSEAPRLLVPAKRQPLLNLRRWLQSPVCYYRLPRPAS